MAQEQIPLLAVVGPTASGKTKLAVELSKRLDGEVVSADSMQIYKGMDIATAKPNEAEKEGIPHHLMDFLDPQCGYSVGQYLQDAKAAILDIHRRGKLPVLAGGTGLYIGAVVDNLDLGASGADPAYRESLLALAREKGNVFLWEMLKEKDPALAETLHPNNLTRVIRALEVCQSGETMSAVQAASRREPSPYRLCMLGLTFADRQKLYDRINRRVDQMAAAGLVREAAAFRARQVKTAAQAIGYKELEPYFRGEISLEAALDSLKQATRHYAKRQLTWFRRDGRIHWLFPDQMGEEELIDEAVRTAKEALF